MPTERIWPRNDAEIVTSTETGIKDKSGYPTYIKVIHPTTCGKELRMGWGKKMLIDVPPHGACDGSKFPQERGPPMALALRCRSSFL